MILQLLPRQLELEVSPLTLDQRKMQSELLEISDFRLLCEFTTALQHLKESFENSWLAVL